MTDCRIALKDVSLRIPVFAPNQLRLINKATIKAAVGGNLDAQDGKVYVQAMKHVTFELQRGDHLALVGHNGAGKSTMLKVIGGIYPASSGEVIVEGRVGCLFDIEAGITPEMTGYECIQFQHMIYGDPQEEWQILAERVAAFTELGGYLELPVRTYSAGMRARLMGALATAWFRDILLIDEGIGAGDQAFQDKMQRRINELLENAGLLVIASHSNALLKEYCTRGLVMVHGEVRTIGALQEALDYYSQLS